MISALHELRPLKGHTILTWNVQSLLPKIEEGVRISLLANPEIMGICETWLTDLVDDSQITISVYHHERLDRTAASGKKSGGRLVIYYKYQLDITPIEE